MKIIFLQNIITSYRIDLFNEINRQLSQRGIEFEVYYFQESYAERFLPFDKSLMKFAYRVFDGFRFRFKEKNYNLNSSLIRQVFFHDEKTKVVMGSSWNDFNVMILILLKRFGLLKCQLSMWIEANYMVKGERYAGNIKKGLRNFILNSVDGGLVIPGKIARDTVVKKWGIAKKLYMLPNLLDGAFFERPPRRGNKQRRSLRLVTVARLKEVDKGIVNFLQGDELELLKNCEWRIAGDGPDAEWIQTIIRDRGLIDNVKLLGNISKKNVKMLYDWGDIYVLPSFSDPNPLTVVEALHNGLPLLLSSRCGNAYEAVVDQVNGVTFDPYKHNAICNALNFFWMNRHRIPEMSQESKKIADSRFHLEQGVSQFLSDIGIDNLGR
jgi:glycosyltransferase involved in cell wall biosynthesis